MSLEFDTMGRRGGPGQAITFPATQSSSCRRVGGPLRLWGGGAGLGQGTYTDVFDISMG
jgi:hypothetical protein